MKLRLDRADGAPVLVLPPRASLAAGEAFVLDHLEWIEERREARPVRRPFADGVEFPYLDDTLVIAHAAGRRLGVRREGRRLVVSGDGVHVNRRVTDWLKVQARREIGERARSHAAATGVRVTRIRIADQKSRWGSCSSTGVLSFNWRLILSPALVLDFVSAHEVAHMREMNHGPAFHRLVADLHPAVHRAETWLRENGAELRAWG